MAQKAIGPAFGAELMAAAVSLEGYSWGADGTITFNDEVTQATRDQVAAVLAAHDPTRIPVAQQLAAKLAAGCAITSAASPQLNASYPLDPQTLLEIVGVQEGVTSGRGLPGGLSTVPFLDTSGNVHNMVVADFTNWAAAIRDYVAALQAVARALAGGQQVAWPAQPVGIP